MKPNRPPSPAAVAAACWIVACAALALAQQAVAQPAPATRPAASLAPFRVFSWARPVGRCPRVTPIVQVVRSSNFLDAANALRALPPGQRVFMPLTDSNPSRSCQGTYLNGPKDRTADAKALGVWPDPSEMAAWHDRLFAWLKQRGASIDFIALDFEGTLSNWAMNPDRLRSIEADPRFPELRQRLGFGDLSTTVGVDLIRTHTAQVAKWNDVTEANLVEGLNRGIMEPARRYYPQVGGCNYNVAQISPENRQDDLNGWYSYYTGPVFGTHNSSVHYASLGNAKDFNLPLEGKAVDWADPWTTLLWQCNLARAVARSSAADNLPWLQGKTLGSRNPHAILAQTPWWDELTRHVLLHGKGRCLYFNPLAETPADRSPTADEPMEAVLADLEHAAGGVDIARVLSSERISYDATYVLTAVQLADHSTLARITFRDGTDTVQVKIAGAVRTLGRHGTSKGAWFHFK